jgi:uncharacterized membrane protein
MSDNPVQVIMAAFNSPETAGQVMADLKQGKRAGLIDIMDAAVVVKDANGKLKIADSKHRKAKGFVTGGVLGGLIGLLAAPPAAALAAGGGAIGALAGKLKGIPLESEMREIGSALPPESSAILAIVEHDRQAQLEALEAAVADAADRLVGDTIKSAIESDIAEQLNAGGSVLYTAGAGTNAAGVGRVAQTPEKTEISGFVAADGGIPVENAEITDEPLTESA